MNKWIRILLMGFLAGTISCKPKVKCNCSNENVCISFINASGQNLKTLKIISHGIIQVTIDQLAHNDTACLSFTSTGESTFNVVAIFKNGTTIKSAEMYCEGGYRFSATAAQNEIKINYNNTY